jgi:hypothetical protein
LENIRIEFDEEVGAVSYSPNECVGIGINEASLNTVYEDVRLTNVEVINAPTQAIGLCFGNGTLKNFSGHNIRIVRPGSGTAAGINPLHRRAIVIDPNMITGSFTLTGVEILDDRATTKMTRAIVISASTAVAAPVTIQGNVTVSGTTPTAYEMLIEKADNGVTPLVFLGQYGVGTINFTPTGTFKLGSMLFDRPNGIDYIMLTDGGNVFSPRPAFAQIAAVPDLDPAATLADVISSVNAERAAKRAAKVMAP